MSSPARTLTAPRPPEPPPPSRFPLVATVAPLVVSVVLFAITKSAFTLVFAALGPVVAIASTVDGAIHRRRTRQREAARFQDEVARVAESIDAAHAEERGSSSGTPRILDLSADPSAVLRRWSSPVPEHLEVRAGTGDVPSTVRYEQSSAAGAAQLDAALAELRDRVAVLRDAPIAVRVTNGIGILGPAVLAAAAARAVAAQLAMTLSPRDWTVVAPPDAEEWVARIPHRLDDAGDADELRFVGGGRQVRVVHRPTSAQLPRELDSVIELGADGSATVAGATIHPQFLAKEEALSVAETLGRISRRAGIAPLAFSTLPEAVGLRALDPDSVRGEGLSAVVGMSTDGPVALDLVSQGPHAIVGGTTGSGKSELLVTWVLGMAAARSPVELTFLFVDFKGGASFGSLVELPHSVGVITDLDAEQAIRALASLSAELRYRERTLAASGLRSIADAETLPFPRLVVVVDEYAALVETFPALHSVFADIAARGRSLGVHLILCTQRPAGIVRDGILANCAMRVSLRVSAAADSVAVLGTDDAARLPARPPGRALVSGAGEPPSAFQVALSDATDVLMVRERWRDASPPRPPWLPPLPTRIPLERLESADTGSEPSGGIVFALADLPAEQAQRAVGYRPREHGSLLVVGAAAAGKSGALAALAASPLDFEVFGVPTDLPHLWDFATAVLDSAAQRGANRRGRVALLDDLDSALASCPEAYQGAVVELLTRVLRDGPAAGLWCVLSAQRVGGALHGLATLCGSTLVLRMPSRAEHALAGGEAGEYVPSLPAGGGHWRGSRIQIALAAPSTDEPSPLTSSTVHVGTEPLAVASTRPEDFAALIRDLAPHRRIVPLAPATFGAGVGELEVSRGDLPPIFLADPDVWQSQWSLLASLQRSGFLLLDGCSLPEFRALTRSRDLPPPFPAAIRPLWLRTPDGEVSRATLAND